MTRFTLTAENELLFDDGGMNLLSSSALHELRDLLSSAQLRDRETAQPLVFRSGRPNIFAAGADMAEMQRFSPRDAYEFARLGQETFEAIERAPFLTIAQIDGDCFGGALDLILAFDFRFATPRARFAHPGARLGIVTGFGGTSRWRRVIARPAAHQLFLANRVIDAEEALAIGLVDSLGGAAAASAAGPRENSAAEAAAAPLKFIKQLAIHADKLSRAELLLVARRLGGIYLP
ncbi:MAG: enoyl-CoA hydratase [Acidobacteria bacterium]|nr:MAG: enoyl-CoA hydratase [Acidobacteriota bacterium]